MSTLTINDSTVLTQLFDLESAPTSASPSIDPSLPSDPHIPSDLLQTLKQTELKAIKLAESSPTSLPESRKLLEELTITHPTYASGHNNLAQVLRMLSAPATEILPHLNEAIKLSSPPTPTSPLSPSQAKILSQAYTQRAAIYYSMFKQEGDEDMEAAASRDFFEGGRYGNSIAREMAVRTNPYARLCGAIVKEAMKNEYGECL
ncbi:hypothetical protein L873DRAFT_1738448 [Choiromyces venosus 120613-1]|uniref:Uncharacterized protein n=1 Tax=Choiromyces venosus 120613-1 TaxID=1336337 RepID=A0A3N4K0P4_9PEZI|nr:hypothetical protein L873DRAFT_1738448 [Choiromyces venosus 120613-1]